MSENTSMKEFLAEHPKMVGALFTLTLLLSQAGNVLAGGGSACKGP